jgi:hypothetical protein
VAPWSRLIGARSSSKEAERPTWAAGRPLGSPHHLHPERTNAPHIGGRITIMWQEASTRQGPTKHSEMGPKRRTQLAGLVEAVARSSTDGLNLTRQSVRAGNDEAGRVEREAALTALEGLIEQLRVIVELMAGGQLPDRDAGLKDLRRRLRVVADEVTGLSLHAAPGDCFIDLLEASDCTWRAVLALDRVGASEITPASVALRHGVLAG